MGFILQNKISGEVAACQQINHYDLPYYGVKQWPDKAAAETEAPALLESKGVASAEDWMIVTADEPQIKMMNVKLKNNPSMQVFEQDGRITAGFTP